MISDEFIVDDATGALVPEDRHGDPAAVAVGGPRIDLVQVARAAEPIAGGAGEIGKVPALDYVDRMDDRDADGLLQAEEGAIEERPVRPGAGIGDVEMVAARLGLKAAFAGWAGCAVDSYPVAEGRGGTDETAVRRDEMVDVRPPCAFHQHAHAEIPLPVVAGGAL